MSKQAYSPDDAWQAFRRQDYALAGQIWLGLMEAASEPWLQNAYRFNYTFVLMEQGQFTEALAILDELYEITGEPIFLHQMAIIAGKAGDLPRAREYLLAERQLLERQDHAALANNACELGRVALQQQELAQAHALASESLTQALAAADPIALGSAHRLLGDVLCALSKEPEARHHYQAAFLAHGGYRHTGGKDYRTG